jgi:outer membrane protein assembly factor BamB
MSSNLWFLHRRQHQAIDAFWDTVVERSPAEPIRPERVDAASAGTIRRLHALAPQPAPSLAFADRLLAELTATIPETGQAAPAPPHTDTNGETIMTTATIAAPSPPKWFPTLPEYRKTRRWAIAQLAAAALLIAALLGGYFWFEGRNDQPAVVVQPATPEPTPGSGWTQGKGNAARTGVGNAGPTGQPIELWRFQAGGPCMLGAVVVDQTIYAECGELYALDALDGSEIWRFTADGPISGGLSTAGDLVYVIDSVSVLYAVDRTTGSEVWRFGSPVFGSPAIEDGLFVTGSPDGMLVGIDAQTGAERWRYQVTDSGETNTPAIANGVVYVGSTVGGLVAVDAETGELRWRVDTPEGGTGTPAVADNVVFIGSFAPDGSSAHFAFDAETGEMLWNQTLQYGTVSIQDGVGYGVNQNDQVSNVIAFDTSDGSELWRTAFTPTNRPIAVAGDVVYVPNDGEQLVYALDAATGRELWQFEVDGPMNASVAVTDGRLYAATTTGSMYAIGGTGESIIAAPGSQASPPATPLAQAEASPIAVSSPGASIANPVELVWTVQGGDGGFDNPARMAIDSQGRIWVTDSGNSRFQIYDTDGNFIETWGAQGSGNGQFQLRRANGDGLGEIDFAPDGSFYVLDPGNVRVQKFDADRNFVTSWGEFGSDPGQFGSPITLALALDGTIWVGDDIRQEYQQFSADGEFLASFSPPNGAEVGALLAVTPSGNLIGSTFPANDILEYDSNGDYLRTIAGAGNGEGQFKGQPPQIAFGESGTMFFTETPEGGRVQLFGQDGTFLAGWGEEGQFPAGIVVDKDGDLYVTDYLANTLSKYRLLPPLVPEATPTV